MTQRVCEDNLSSRCLDAIRCEQIAQPRVDVGEKTVLTDGPDSEESFARGLLYLGCGLALDDFGTGFGTFTYLKRIPIKFLKIDIEFVRDLGASAANRHIVKAIVNLAEAFGCQTIAEGVEDEATVSVLREFGVDFVQGFHLGRPAPIVERR